MRRAFARTLLLGAAILLAPSRALPGQMSLAVGVGGGLAGSTDASLSNGLAAPILMVQLTPIVAPLVAVGAEVDYWRRSAAHAVFATAIARVRLPATPFFVKIGAGYGSGNPGESQVSMSGVAGQIGAGYDIGIPGAPVGLALFGNAYLAYSAARSIQMVDAGLSVVWR